MGWEDVVKYVAVALGTSVLLYHFVLRRFCVDTTPRNLQVYMALRSPSVREARSALERRLALAVREASQGSRACVVCGFANTTREAVLSCVLCGAALPVAPKRWPARLFGKNPARDSDEIDAPHESSRQRRVRRRHEWVRRTDSEGAVVWYQHGRALSQEERLEGGFEFYVLQASYNQLLQSPAPSPNDESPAHHGTEEGDGAADMTVVVDSTAGQQAALSIATVSRQLEAVANVSTIRVVNVRESDASHVAFASSTIDATAIHHAQLDFPAKLVQFMTSVASLLSETGSSEMPPVARLFIARDQLWGDSVDAIATLPADQTRLPIRVAFIGEPGIDAGALYREWIGVLNKTLVTPEAGIFICVDPHEQTFYLNAHSRELLGENHLAHFLVAGRLIGRALLDGNVTGFQLAPPLLKIILGLPVGFDDLEYFDAEAFKSLQWLLTNDGVDALGLDFTVVEKLPGGKMDVVELVPDGREIDVTDANKLEYIDRKLKYLFFESVQSQLFAFLTGLYEVAPADLLVAFDAEELALLLSGSDEIDVDDWEANTIAFLDQGRGNSGQPLSVLPYYENFWRVVRDMSNDERRRLLHFATGSTRPPPGGFSSLTSYDGRLALFTLRGVSEETTHGNLCSHACFNRVDLPTFWTLKKMHVAIHAAISVHEDGFTIA